MFPILLLALSLFLPLVTHAMPNTQVYDTRAGKTLTQAALLDRLAQADVVLVGEEHTDPATHAMELQLLTGLHQRAGKRLTLAMEMWERDTQPALDAYLQDRTDEAAFLQTARPWSNYHTDYRPLVEFARANGIPIIASNVPQALASRVGKEGLTALKDAPTGQAATLIQTPHDGAWTRFRATMTAMGESHGTMDEATIARFYEAQCLRDETMAESITQRLDAAAPDGLVLHLNGQFHSDFGEGIPRRVLWRRPLTKIAVVSVIPSADPGKEASLTEKTKRDQADFLVFVPAPAP